MCFYFLLLMVKNSSFVCSLITEKNCEHLCLLELKNRFNISGQKQDGFVDFTASNDVALKVAYFAQSPKRILLKISSGSFSGLEDLSSKIFDDLKNNDSWIFFVEDKYRVNCDRLGSHEFNSVLVEQEVSARIKKVIESKNISALADYDTKDLFFYVQIIDDKYLFGIDYAGRDLSKRHYLFFNNPNAIKGNLAFNLLLFANYHPGMLLLDSFSLAGVVPIEAALYERNLSIHFFSKDFLFPSKIKEHNEALLKDFDSLNVDEKFNNVFSCDPSFPNLASQKKNSRIAGVERDISFSRVDINNLDIKNFPNDIDIFVSRIIEPSKHVPVKKVSKTYDDFFIAADNFLSKSGSINVVLRVPDLLEEVALNHGFVVKDKLETAQGKQQFFFVKLVKK